MKVWLLILCSPALWGCRPSAAVSHDADPVYHTHPDEWSEPRDFQTPFEPCWADRVVLDRVAATRIEGERTFSPNKAYWFVVAPPDTSKPGPWSAAVYVFNEREHLIRLGFPDLGSGAPRPRWINEKLLYVRVWLGHVLGVDLILDVEKEQIVYREMTNDGSNAFLQAQQVKEWRRSRSSIAR